MAELSAKSENFGLNLRRLLLFHHRTQREAATALGVSQWAVCAWLAGKRYPRAEALVKIGDTYHLDPRLLFGDPVAFAQQLADPERLEATGSARGSCAGVL